MSIRLPFPAGRAAGLGAAAAASSLAVGVAPIGCTPTELADRHAARVEQYLPTPFVPESAPYVDPERALGPPDGRTVALGRGSHVVLRFFRSIRDGRGPDLRIYEIGPDEAEARVAVSRDGRRWIELGERVAGLATDLDLAGLDIAPVEFVRIRGLDSAGIEPGFDLDAVEALH